MKPFLSIFLICAIFFLVPAAFGTAQDDLDYYFHDTLFDDEEDDPIQPPVRVVVSGDSASQPIVIIQNEHVSAMTDDSNAKEEETSSAGYGSAAVYPQVPPPPPLPEGFPSDPDSTVAIRVIVIVNGQEHVVETNVARNPPSGSSEPPPPPRVPPQVSAPASRPAEPETARQPAAPEASQSPPAQTESPAPVSSGTGLNRVQVGSFTVPSLAQTYFNNLRAAGFTTAAIERYQNLYRVVIPGVRPADVPQLEQRLRAAGFNDIWIRREY